MRNAWRRAASMALMTLMLAVTLVGCASTSTNGPTKQATPVATTAPASTNTRPTVADLLDASARGAVGAAVRKVETTYDASAEKLIVTLTITGKVPLTDAQMAAAWERAKTLCFQEENALWASGLPLRQVMVVVVGPTKGEYNEILDGWYGISVVGEATARHIPWATATPDSVWNSYDQSMLRNSFDLFDEIPASPPAPTATGS